MKTNLAALARHLPKTEVRLEVVLEDLIERGYLAPDKLTVVPQGLFARGYNPDVLDATWDEKTSQLHVRVCREGLYDLLPKTLFHPPKTAALTSTADDRAALIEQTAQQEQEARQFFLPFEQSLFRQRLAIESEERELLAGFANPVHDALFIEFFGVVDFLTAYQREILFCLLPMFSRITGDAEMTARSFAALLGVPVHIAAQARSTTVLKASNLSASTDDQLGLSWLLGDGNLLEEAPHWTLTIGPVDAATLPKYLPGGNHDRSVALLARYLLPAELDYDVEVVPETAVGLFNLNETAHAGRLGFSTMLGAAPSVMK